MHTTEERPTRARVWLVLLAALVPACGEKVQPTYDLEIVTPADTNPFLTARTVTLQVEERMPSTVTLKGPDQPFQLTVEGVDLRVPVTGRLRVSAFDGDGLLVAYGETPPLELVATNYRPRVFVQRPGSLARFPDELEPPHADLAATTAIVPSAGATATSTAVFGLGAQYVSVATNTQGVVPSGSIFVFDPFRLLLLAKDELFGAVQARTGATATALADGEVVMFGGFTNLNRIPMSTVGNLDRFTITREGFSFVPVLEEGSVVPTDPRVARGNAPLASTGSVVYAFGGETAEGAVLDSIVSIDPASATGAQPFVVLPATMRTPRVGHTANVVARPAPEPGSEILIFGGSNRAQVAELFRPDGATTVPLPAPEGAARRDHVAVALDSRRVLLIGGIGPNGAPLATSVLYNGTNRTLALSGPVLAVARSRPVAFLVGQDLVVAGGLGADGAPVTTVEVFDAAQGFAPVPAASGVAQPRIGGAAFQLPNETVLVAGGWTDAARTLPTAAMEIYRPRKGVVVNGDAGVPLIPLPPPDAGADAPASEDDAAADAADAL